LTALGAERRHALRGHATPATGGLAPASSGFGMSSSVGDANINLLAQSSVGDARDLLRRAGLL
jgi:hypothetical protein